MWERGNLFALQKEGEFQTLVWPRRSGQLLRHAHVTQLCKGPARLVSSEISDPTSPATAQRDTIWRPEVGREGGTQRGPPEACYGLEKASEIATAPQAEAGSPARPSRLPVPIRPVRT